jgi:hypothetical protein
VKALVAIPVVAEAAMIPGVARPGLLEAATVASRPTKLLALDDLPRPVHRATVEDAVVDKTRAVVLVEGISDVVALETLAERHERDLDAERIAIVPIGGAHSIGRYLERFGPGGEGLKLAGLCDAGEERQFRRGLERTGFGSELSREEMEELGFYVCVEDLEDELIRALGAKSVEQILADHGDLGPFRTLQKQPAWRGQPLADQLRRFMGSGGSRKIRYARLLVEALDLAQMPRPLNGVLAHV